MVCFVFGLVKYLWGEGGGKCFHPSPISGSHSPPHTNLEQEVMLRVETMATSGKLQQCGY